MITPSAWRDSAGSPDPTTGRELRDAGNGWRALTIYPHAIAWCSDPAVCRQLSLHEPAPPLHLTLSQGEFDLVIDFGTELEGAFHATLETSGAGTVSLTFGESLPEAREWGLATTCADQRPLKQLMNLHAGRHELRGETGGFRFVRIRLGDFAHRVTLSELRVEALLMGAAHRGNFTCSDPALQRLWHSSVYTARLCTRPEGFWDGIKRDRLGWYGDARITQETWDLAFHEPEPAEAMLQKLETTSWANAIPNYSFDAVAMLRSHLLRHGTERPAIAGIWSLVQHLLDWIIRTQSSPEGLITRRDDTRYFFDIGFTDWSPQPIGGRLEEWAPLQFAWLECLRNVIDIAGMLGQNADAWQPLAQRLHRLLRERFAIPSGGFHHTLNQGEPQGTPWRMPLQPGLHHRLSYTDQQGFGPSGPSLQAGALAVLAGLAAPAEHASLLRAVFHNRDLPPVITTYFHYYLLEAQARCGDTLGAFDRLRSYFMPMLDEYGSATIWESFEPEKHGLAALSLNQWPKSLCHAWGTCAVPWITRWLAGLEVLAPGYLRVRLHPPAIPDLHITLKVPTPHGDMELRNGRWRVPDGIEACNGVAEKL